MPGSCGTWPQESCLPENSSPFRHRVIRRVRPLPSVVLSRGRIGKATDAERATLTGAPRNRFLARLPEADYRRLLPLLQPVSLTSGQILYEARGPIDYAYFPTGAVLSALTVMQDGNAIEVATIGNEGLVGHYGSGGKSVAAPGDRADRGRWPADRGAGTAGGGREGGPAEGAADGLPHRVHVAGVAVGGLQRPASACAAMLSLAADEPRPGRVRRLAADARVPGHHAGRTAGRA